MSAPLIWDNTLSWGAAFRDAATLPRLRAAGYGVVSLTVGADRADAARIADAAIAAVMRSLDEDPEAYLLVRQASDVRRAQREGRLGLALNFQGIGPLQGDLDRLVHYRALGVRQIGLVWNGPNAAGSSATQGADEGLTAFGRQLLTAMTQLGIIADGAHASYRTTLQAMEASTAPFVFSHANVHALAPSYKNLRDDQIRACAATGGVIGISGFGSYLDDPAADVEALFRQIDHVATLVGAAHVGLGLDFVTDAPRFWQMVREQPALWPAPDGGPMPPSQFFPPEGVRPLRRRLLDAGYAAADVAAILGENWVRIGERCWR